jgi:hypothetical protein
MRDNLFGKVFKEVNLLRTFTSRTPFPILGKGGDGASNKPDLG